MLRVGEERIEPLFKIGLTQLDLRQWFEIDDQLADYRTERDRLAASERQNVLRLEPGTEAAQAEVRRLIEANLRENHPDVAFPEDSGGPDLLEAARLVQDDLVLMRRDDSGWRLVGAALFFRRAGRWRTNSACRWIRSTATSPALARARAMPR